MDALMIMFVTIIKTLPDRVDLYFDCLDLPIVYCLLPLNCVLDRMETTKKYGFPPFSQELLIICKNSNDSVGILTKITFY